ncbi:alpha-hydroxy acid oxidase [Paraburkholderia nemoris]|jgi:L-lactate dehydrogenase (FMN-dependent) and related alpha-hydroxy acid dehydrogenases|uniref:alpha-hydroxy acid oxidase n=1 Tax=Paraburkholderia nemoris TaxID=2793076 RepID=UPI001B07249E|nr:alpha-hydroxy acid oxidase [Paraburkholderia nemoris]CAE6747441.1 (S)-mandelate dehydrogenase [Paraburkholderia nemoris]
MKTEQTKQHPVQTVPRTLRRYLSLDDFELAARRHLPRPIFGYIAGAAERNTSLDDNQRAYSEYRFVTRVLRDVSGRTQATTLLGKTYRAPFGIAPMGISALSAYRGDIVQAEAAQEAGIPMIMSGSSLIPLEVVARDAPGTWFQAYLPGESEKIQALVERVERAGYDTLVVTVDAAVLANRENNIRTGFSTPLKPGARLAWDGVTRPRWLLGTALKTLVKHGMPHFENSYATRGAPIFSGRVVRDFGAKDHLNWSHIRQIRAQWKGKLVIKGIMAAEDAIVARDHGVDGIIVSNHGGRQLDSTAAPLRVLPRIVDAVGRDIAVMIDGGIRRGTDVLKALALGADFVFVGRPFNYAASVAGKAGVAHAIGILYAEVQRNLGLLGLERIDELSPDVLIKLPGNAIASGGQSQ